MIVLHYRYAKLNGNLPEFAIVDALAPSEMATLILTYPIVAGMPIILFA